ncbi:MAG: ribonuclease H-like domain-containing protein [Pseudomonadota bacterium]
MTNFLYQNDLPSNLNLGDSIAIDTETTGLNLKRDRLCVIQISSGDGDVHLVRFDKNNYNAPNLKKLLSDPKVLKIFHFARFDLAVLKSHLGVEIQNIYCTKIASKLVRTYSDAHGLKAICKELIGVELSKDQQSSDWGNENISEEQIKYAASDVLYLHRLKEKLDEMLKREGRFAVANQCFQFLQTRSTLDLSGFEGDIFSH